MSEMVMATELAIAEQQVAEQRSLWDRVKGAAGRVALVGMLMTGATAGIATAEDRPAHAAENYGDYLSGQYASDTHCQNDAETIAEADITALEPRWNVDVSREPSMGSSEVEVTVGKIELRYSATCKTKWARMSTTRNTDIDKVSIMQDTGYKQSRHVSAFWEGAPAATAYTPMIYTPDNRVHAYVEGDNLLNQSTDWK